MQSIQQALPPPPPNFQNYIQKATSLVKGAKAGIKLIKDLDVAAGTAEAALTGIFSSYLTPVTKIIGQFRTYVPVSIPSLPGAGGIGGLGNLSLPNVGIGDLNNNAINTLGLKNL